MIGSRGHATEIARRVLARLERAFADGELRRTPELDRAAIDLALVLGDAGDDQGTPAPGDDGNFAPLGGKSPEAARLILRAIDRNLDAA
jgi:hypothetical protein